MRTPHQQVRTHALPTTPAHAQSPLPGSPTRARAARPPLPHALPSLPQALPSVAEALRAVEALLLGGGQRTARRNAWASVLEDRRRARARVEAQHVLEAAASRAPSDT